MLYIEPAWSKFLSDNIKYEGEPINNQLIQFPIDLDDTVFLPCFNTGFTRGYKIARLLSHSFN